MNINTSRRPWEKSTTQGNRYKPDAFYQSSAWRRTRESFRKGSTMVDGFSLLNIYCVDCFRESRRLVEAVHTDHIIARKAGGSDEHDNLQTLCTKHHAIKSSNEGKKEPGK